MDSTTDLALVSPRIVPWLSAEMLTPHGSDHLPGCSAYKGQLRSKTSNHITPSGVKGGSKHCVKTARGNQEHKSWKAHGKSKKQPPWWISETEKTWTKNKQTKKVPKGGTQPNPDPTLKAAMDTQTEQFKQRERQKKLSGKAAVKNSVLKQCWHCS